MRFLRWAVSLLSNSRDVIAGFFASGRLALSRLTPRAAILLVGLAFLTAGIWPLSHELALVVVGLFLIRDAESKPADES